MVNTREIAAEYRLSHWAQIMQERTGSGLSIRAFCKQNGISNNTYFYWQRKLRTAACTELATAQSVSEKSLVPNGWTVCTEEPTPEKKALTIEVGGCRIFVEPGVDPELLSKVCRTLRSLC